MELKPCRILAAVDPAEPAQTALEAARLLASHYGAVLEMTAVFELPPLYLMAAAEAGGPEIDWEEPRNRVLDRLGRLAEGLSEEAVHLRVEEGQAAEVLSRMAASAAYGLVVMGTHGYTGFKHVVFGSVAESVVRRCAVPVLTVPLAGRLDRPKRLLVPYNMTPYADAALTRALAFADDWAAEVTVLHVAEGSSAAAGAVERLGERLAASLGVDEARRVAAVVREGQAARGVIEEAVSGRHDLVVLSAHRSSLLRDAVLGTTAERVLRHSPIPVLAVPSDAA
ncbi:MAG: universal stress protein [Elusimicrobia bacterium]|nr:universal stress protein [Elusimicrobiota bacterium]